MKYEPHFAFNEKGDLGIGVETVKLMQEEGPIYSIDEVREMILNHKEQKTWYRKLRGKLHSILSGKMSLREYFDKVKEKSI